MGWGLIRLVFQGLFAWWHWRGRTLLPWHGMGMGLSPAAPLQGQSEPQPTRDPGVPFAGPVPVS